MKNDRVEQGWYRVYEEEPLFTRPQVEKALRDFLVYAGYEITPAEPIGFMKPDLVARRTDGKKLYLRHKAFDLNLAETSGARHIIPTSSFLDGQPQHRTCWTLAATISTAIWGDIMASNGTDYYEVRGFPLYVNHSYFDPRRSGYTLFAGRLDSSKAPPKAPPASIALPSLRASARLAGRSTPLPAARPSALSTTASPMASSAAARLAASSTSRAAAVGRPWRSKKRLA